MTFADIIRQGSTAVGPVIHVLEDPSLNRITLQINELHSIEQKSPSTKTRKSDGSVPGVGLGKLVTPLDIFIKLRKNPVLVALLGLGLIGVPFALGYILGSR